MRRSLRLLLVATCLGLVPTATCADPPAQRFFRTLSTAPRCYD